MVSSERKYISREEEEWSEEVDAPAFRGLITIRAAAGSRRPLKGRTVILYNGRAGTIRYISTVLRTNSFVSSSTTLRQRALHRHVRTPGIARRIIIISDGCHRSHGELFPSIVNSPLSYLASTRCPEMPERRSRSRRLRAT